MTASNTKTAPKSQRMDLADLNTLKSLRARVIEQCYYLGQSGDHVEDIAQMVLLKFWENPDSKQTVTQACIDAIREMFGRNGDHREKDIFSTHGEETAAFIPTEAIDFESYIKNKVGAHRVAWILHYVFGYSDREIGFIFGIQAYYVGELLKE